MIRGGRFSFLSEVEVEVEVGLKMKVKLIFF
jgi:hypothetical protein